MSASHALELLLADEAATEALGAALARALPPASPAPLWLALQGELGAGKTTLARALLRALGECGPVRSPSYTLLEPYELPDWSVRHLDLYRLSDPSEVQALGVRDELQPGTLWLVEWPERGAGQLPPPDLHVCLVERGPVAGRTARICAQSSAGVAWLGTLSVSCSA
jgi:tRNA threonylcarbamoyladenosine biosynthesis protein TsaE